MNRTTIVNFALREYGEATSPAHFGGTTPVIAWLNDVKRQFEIEAKIYFGTVRHGGTTGITAGQRIATIPTSMFSPQFVRYKGNYLTKTTRTELIGEEANSAFMSATGTPSNWYIPEGFNGIGVYPIPKAGAGGTLVVEGYRTSADLTTGSAIPSFPPQYHRALVAGLKLRFAEEDNDNARSQAATAKAAAEWQRYVMAATRESWPNKPRLIVHGNWGR